MKKKNSEMKTIGVGEKLQYLVHESNDNTVRCQLLYPGCISEKNMETAVLYIVQHIDVLHSSFISKNGKQYWKINSDVSGKDCFRAEYIDGNPMLLSDAAMLKSAAPAGKAQLFCTLTQGKMKVRLP